MCKYIHIWKARSHSTRMSVSVCLSVCSASMQQISIYTSVCLLYCLCICKKRMDNAHCTYQAWEWDRGFWRFLFLRSGVDFVIVTGAHANTYAKTTKIIHAHTSTNTRNRIEVIKWEFARVWASILQFGSGFFCWKKNSPFTCVYILHFSSSPPGKNYFLWRMRFISNVTIQHDPKSSVTENPKQPNPMLVWVFSMLVTIFFRYLIFAYIFPYYFRYFYIHFSLFRWTIEFFSFCRLIWQKIRLHQRKLRQQK